MWDKNSFLNRDLIAKEASKIASVIGLKIKNIKKLVSLWLAKKA